MTAFMLRRQIIAAVSCAGVAFASNASASAGWMSGGEVVPSEQRVAIAAGPKRTVVWTSLKYRGSEPIALVIPAAKGAAVDLASDAWFEALEANTAPRIFPPSSDDGCAGSAADITDFDVAGSLAHTRTTPPSSVSVLASADAVDAWASAHQMFPSGSLDGAMRALGSSHFLVIEFPAAESGATTATVRITTEASDLRVPLMLTQAGPNDLLVTTFLLGPARASLAPETPASIDGSSLAWFPETKTSSYDADRAQALSASSETTLTESAGHDGLLADAPIAFGFDEIEGLAHAYFQRGGAYDADVGDTSACLEDATKALTAIAPVAKSCPLGALATVGAESACVESTPAGTTSAAALRCGSLLDDLALGLEGLSPAEVWLTRESLLVEAMHPGVDLSLAFPGGPVVSNQLTAARIDTTGCPSSGNSGSGKGSGKSSGGSVNGGGIGNIDLNSDDGGGCDGGDSGGDDCDGGDQGGDDCDSGGADACSSGSPGSCDCTFGHTRKPRGSIVLMTLAALLAIARRRGKKARSDKNAR